MAATVTNQKGDKRDHREGTDRLRTWRDAQGEILQKLQTPDAQDQCITLHHGPQLFYTMRNPNSIKCMSHFPASNGEVFVTHFRFGTQDQLSFWHAKVKDREATCTQTKFDINHELSCVLFVSKHRTFLGFSTDLKLCLYTDSTSKCSQLSVIECNRSILCMAYNRDMDEIYLGGIGGLEKWKVTGAEHSATLKPMAGFVTNIGPDEWVIDIKVDTKNKQIMVLSYHNIFVINYELGKQTHQLQNRHEGALKCCCFYKQKEYIITGGGDGSVKVWNAVVFTQVHVFYGHHAAVTGLAVHNTSPLLFTSSLDGSIQIWRMDNFLKLMRFDLAEKIYSMKLLGTDQFYCQTEHEIKLFNLNQFHHLFLPVESTVHCLQLFMGDRQMMKGNRIIASTEDGSVRLFSPITGTVLTLIYPMPSFQILKKFSYDHYRERLLTVLENGDVISFNCRTNPCRADELWQPSLGDEAVAVLSQMHVIYQNYFGKTETDILVFGGLLNGQISLVDSARCEMLRNLQAHAGAITCMEVSAQLSSEGQLVPEGCHLVTGGDDKLVKVWQVQVMSGKRSDVVQVQLILKIPTTDIPSILCMYNNLLCTVMQAPAESVWPLQMYRIEGDMSSASSLSFLQLQHPTDEDHTSKVSAIDKCPHLGIFATTGLDGFIKVWNCHNHLIREMEFAEPLFAVCFANTRGDILFGFHSHVCSIPIVNYLPHHYLERIVLQDFEDDIREKPVPYNSNFKTWFDPNDLAKFSTQLSHRKMEKLHKPHQDLHLEDLEVDKNISMETGVHFSPNISPDNDLGPFGDTSRSVSQRSSRSSRSMRSLKSRQSVERKKETMETQSRELVASPTVSVPMESVMKKPRKVLPAKPYDPLDELTPWERELLKRRGPIIPIDGYIPNSKVRKNLGYIRPVTPVAKKEDAWTLKPMPKINPKHMPDGWKKPEDMEVKVEPQYQNKNALQYDSDVAEYSWGSGSDEEGEEGEEGDSSTDILLMPCLSKKKSKRRKSKTQKPTPYELQSLGLRAGRRESLLREDEELPPFYWNDDEEEDKARNKLTQNWKKSYSIMRTATTLSNASSRKVYSRNSRKSTPVNTAKFELKSKRYEFGKDQENSLSESRTSSGKHKPRGHSRERSKSFKLSNMVVDEDSTDVTYKKSGHQRSTLFNPDLDIIQNLLKEGWFSDLTGTPSFDSLIQRLIQLLDTHKLEFHRKICDYIIELHKDLGIPDMYLERIISKLNRQLSTHDVEIKKDCLRTLKAIAGNSQELVAALLPRLIDSQSDIRQLAKDMLSDMIGLEDKEDLVQVLEEMGLSSNYNSKEDEEEALRALAMRFDIPLRSESFNDWINNWVEDSSPLMYDNDLQSEDIAKNWAKRGKKVGQGSMHISDLSSQASNRMRELSGFSDLNRWESFSESGRNFASSVVSETIQENEKENLGTPRSSKLSSRFNPKDPLMYQYYRKRFPDFKPGSGGRFWPGNNRLQRERLAGLEEKFKEEDMSMIPTEDSGQGTVLGSTLSEMDESVREPIMEVISTEDSGIGREMSETLSHRSLHRRKHRSSRHDWHKHMLSPVKSSSSLFSGEITSPRKGKTSRLSDWHQFFNTQTALERKRMVMVKKDFNEGRVRDKEPAVINYIANDLPLLPGEAGLRLLQTVKVGNKPDDKDPYGRNNYRHRVEALPGKLSVLTKNEDKGKSNYGILQMMWTTGVPFNTSEDHINCIPRIASCSDSSTSIMEYDDDDIASEMSQLTSRTFPSKKPGLKKVKLAKTSRLPAVSHRQSKPTDYQWATPLPPPPAKGPSKVNLEHIRRQHEKYHRLYNLVQNQEQALPTDELKKLNLPDVVIKNAFKSVPRTGQSQTKVGKEKSILLPPITLNQLIHT